MIPNPDKLRIPTLVVDVADRITQIIIEKVPSMDQSSPHKEVQQALATSREKLSDGTITPEDTPALLGKLKSLVEAIDIKTVQGDKAWLIFVFEIFSPYPTNES